MTVRDDDLVPSPAPRLVEAELVDADAGWDLLTPGRFVVRRIQGSYAVDEWGLDADVVRTVAPFGRAWWRVDTSGIDHVPQRGAALLVHNRGWWWSEVAAVSAAVHRAMGRVPRFVGAPDLALVGPLLRSVGGILARPDEVRSVLRAGHLVSAGTTRGRWPSRRSGEVSVETVIPALEVGVPVVPVVATPDRVGLRWRVRVALPIPTSERTDPDDLAGEVQAALDDLRAGVEADEPPRRP